MLVFVRGLVLVPVRGFVLVLILVRGLVLVFVLVRGLVLASILHRFRPEGPSGSSLRR